MDVASSDEDEDDVLEELPSIPSSNHNRARRTSVSAESMAPTTEPYEKISIPKSTEQRKRIEKSIMNNFLFKTLDEEQHTDVVDAMAEKSIAKGEEVIKQGAVGDYFYVVETGSLDVFVAKGGQAAQKVTEYGPGGAFGELALMYNAPRAATVVATSECVLWALDRVTFRRILMENTSRKRKMYEAFLEELPLLVSLEAYERHKIADALESVTFNDGDVVIKQGDVGDNFYIIESGDARVLRKDDKGEQEFPGLKKGDYFGGTPSLFTLLIYTHFVELALLNNAPRQATIIAKGKLKCATMNKKAFTRLLGPVIEIIKRHADTYAKYAAHQ